MASGTVESRCLGHSVQEPLTLGSMDGTIVHIDRQCQGRVSVGNHSCPNGLKHVCQQQGQRVSMSKSIGCDEPRAEVLRNFQSAGEILVLGVEHNNECNRDTHV